MMELDLGQVLGGAASAVPVRDDAELGRLIDIVVGMQEGINAMMEILIDHKARIATLEIENRRLKARTDAPARSSIIQVN